MQFSATASVDLMPTGRPVNTSAGKTGQDDAFANHLAAASQGQGASNRKTETADPQKDTPAHTEKPTTSAPDDASPQTETLSGPGSDPSHIKDSPAVAKIPNHEDSTKELTTDGTINDSAGAANAAILPVQQVVLDPGRLTEQGQGRAQTSDQTISIVSQMLNAITSATAGTAAGVTATPLVGQSETQTPVPGQANPIVSQMLNAITSATAGTAAGVTATPLAGQSETQTPVPGQAQVQAETTTLQPLGASAVVAETTQNNGTTNPQNTLTQAVSNTPSNAAQIASDATQNIVQQNAAQQSSEQIVQNEYGQIITIHQLNPEEMAAATGVAGKTPATGASSQSQDVDSNYIRSHLPNDAPKVVTNEKNAQQETTKDNQPKGENTTAVLTNGASPTDLSTTQKAQFSIGTENQSLIFAHQPTSTSPAASTSSADALTLRLPSGLNVADGTVVDQMMSHFSVNKQLESGTVNLKLYPQELGELRMEIRVQQDNIKAHIIAQNPQAQEMIDRHMPRLREALEQQGLHLQHIEVTVAAGDQAGGERYQDNARQQLNQSMNKSNSPSIFTLNPDEEMVESVSSINNLSVLA